MAIVINENTTLSEIVKLLEKLPPKNQAAFLRQLKLKHALKIGKKIDKPNTESVLELDDQEIADIVHDYRVSQ